MERRLLMISKSKAGWMLPVYGLACCLCAGVWAQSGNSGPQNKSIHSDIHGYGFGSIGYNTLNHGSLKNTPNVPVPRHAGPGWVLVCGLRMGRSWLEPADFTTTISTFKAAAVENPDWETRTTAFRGLFSAGLDLMAGYGFTGGFWVGIQTGYRHFLSGILKAEQSFSGAAAPFYQTRQFGLDAWAVPVELVFVHPFPILSKVRMRALLGLDLYNAAVAYQYRFENLNGSYWQMGDLKDSGIGYHFHVGFEYPLRNRIYLTLEAGYGWGILNAFEGSIEDSDGVKTDVRLVMEETGYGKKLSLVPGEDMKWLRNAEVDSGGLNILAGLSWEMTFFLQSK